MLPKNEEVACCSRFHHNQTLHLNIDFKYLCRWSGLDTSGQSISHNCSAAKVIYLEMKLYITI